MKNKKIIITLGILISLIVIPLLKPGYIFGLDQVLNPNGWIPKIGGNIFLLGIFSQIFNFFHIPIWIMEKIIIILTFVLPAIGGYLITKKIKNSYAILFASLFLVFNPFLYDRFLDGQINIYLSYSLYPLFLYNLKNTFEDFSIKKAVLLGFFSLILCLISIHNLMFLFFIFIIFSIFYLKKTGSKNILRIGSLILIFNLLWLVPFLFMKTDKFELTKQINNFGENHREAFKTTSGDTNIYFNTLSMHGYWGEVEKRFITIEQANKKWKNLFLVILFLVLTGLYYKIKNKEFGNFEKSLILLAIISYILALGISNNNIFSPINQFLYDYLPMYKGFREPQKWVIFVVIFYAYFGAFGIKFLTEKIEKLEIENFVKKLIIFFLILTPIFYNSQMIFGFNKQVVIKKYPKDWQEIKKIILKENNNFNNKTCKYLKEKKSQKCYNALSFPWHSYIGLSWTKKVVGGWVVRYFGKNILMGDNMEIRNIYTSSKRKESKIIEKYIGPKGIFKNIKKIKSEDLKNFIYDLKGLGIKNIILLKESDFKFYKSFLDILEEKKYIKKIKENDMIILYKMY